MLKLKFQECFKKLNYKYILISSIVGILFGAMIANLGLLRNYLSTHIEYLNAILVGVVTYCILHMIGYNFSTDVLMMRNCRKKVGISLICIIAILITKKTLL